MVIVMVALAHRRECHEQVLGGVDVTVKWLVAPQVCDAVHRPGHVKDEDVAKDRADEVRVPEALIPEVPWNDRRHDKAEQQDRWQVESD